MMSGLVASLCHFGMLREDEIVEQRDGNIRYDGKESVIYGSPSPEYPYIVRSPFLGPGHTLMMIHMGTNNIVKIRWVGDGKWERVNFSDAWKEHYESQGLIPEEVIQ